MNSTKCHSASCNNYACAQCNICMCTCIYNHLSLTRSFLIIVAANIQKLIESPSVKKVVFPVVSSVYLVPYTFITLLFFSFYFQCMECIDSVATLLLSCMHVHVSGVVVI